LPKAAAANRSIFYDQQGTARSVGEIRQIFAAKIAGNNASPRWALNSAVESVRSTSRLSWNSQSAAIPTTTTMPQMRGFEPMPKGLSLNFAHQAYQRLASLGGGARS
jgi:hypothetical protein